MEINCIRPLDIDLLLRSCKLLLHYGLLLSRNVEFFKRSIRLAQLRLECFQLRLKFNHSCPSILCLFKLCLCIIDNLFDLRTPPVSDFIEFSLLSLVVVLDNCAEVITFNHNDIVLFLKLLGLFFEGFKFGRVDALLISIRITLAVEEIEETATYIILVKDLLGACLPALTILTQKFDLLILLLPLLLKVPDLVYPRVLA